MYLLPVAFFDLQYHGWNRADTKWRLFHIHHWAGLFSCSMKNEWGLQCRCSNQDLTLYIIVISQCCWVLLEYTIHFVPKAHANQVFPTRFKTGGVPSKQCGWKKLLGQLQSLWLHQIQGWELETGSAAWAVTLGSAHGCSWGLWGSWASWEFADEGDRVVTRRCRQHSRATCDLCLGPPRWEPWLEQEAM